MASTAAAAAASSDTAAAATASKLPAALYIENWGDWWAAFAQPDTWIDFVVLLATAALAWLAVRALHRLALPTLAALAAGHAAQTAAVAEGGAAPAATARPGAERVSVLFGRRLLDGVLFPLLWLALVYMARTVLLYGVRDVTPLLRVAIPAVVALLFIRCGVTVLRAAFPGAQLVRVLERTISWVVWIGWVLWVSGVLPRVMAFLDTITWKMGGTRISVANLIEGALTAGALMLLALWVSSLIEGQLLRTATGTALSVRKGIANATRAFMLLIGLLLGLSAVGIDLTALSVMGGAVGVGIGLGLQKLAANYVSGFMMLAERSVRIGDLVRVGNFEGRIADIRARYTIVRSLGGVEAIVPNESLMTSMVENLSFSDARVHQSTRVSVGYDSDAHTVQRLLVDAALSCPRVLREPGPSALLSGFGADGLDFTIGYWVGDPENGLGGVRSQVNMAILAALRDNGIDIPYPQRVLRTVEPAARNAPAAPAPNGPDAPDLLLKK